MLRLRRAAMGDWARLLAWRNDPVTRANFTQADVVTPREHCDWLKETLANPDVALFVAEDRDRAVGTGRLDVVRHRKARWGEVSLTVAAEQRGRGYASLLLGALVGQAGPLQLAGLVAHVKSENYASLRTFADCGFAPVDFTPSNVTLERKL